MKNSRLKNSGEIKTKEEFQEELQRLQTILVNVSTRLTRLYRFVENDSTSITYTVRLIDKYVNEALRQLGFLNSK